jgi:ketosteroid isomerase-like protein
MTLPSVLVGISALLAVTVQGGQTLGASADRAERAADLAAIEKVRQQDITATVSRDPVGLTDLWTDDAIRIGVRASNERVTANKNVRVLSYVPETRDFTFLEGGWAVEWRSFTASYLDSPAGEAKQVRGTVLVVWKKLPDGSWKVFRGMAGAE